MLTQTTLLRWASQQPVEHRELEEACDTSLGLSVLQTVSKSTTRSPQNVLEEQWPFPSQDFSLCFLVSKNLRPKSSMPRRNLHTCIFTNVREETCSVEVRTLMTHPEASGLGPHVTPDPGKSSVANPSLLNGKGKEQDVLNVEAPGGPFRIHFISGK